MPYPPGVGPNTPGAPWNEPEVLECEYCNGVYGDHGTVDTDECECYACLEYLGEHEEVPERCPECGDEDVGRLRCPETGVSAAQREEDLRADAAEMKMDAMREDGEL